MSEDINLKVSVISLNSVEGIVILINDEVYEKIKDQDDFFESLGRSLDDKSSWND